MNDDMRWQICLLAHCSSHSVCINPVALCCAPNVHNNIYIKTLFTSKMSRGVLTKHNQDSPRDLPVTVNDTGETTEATSPIISIESYVARTVLGLYIFNSCS